MTLSASDSVRSIHRFLPLPRPERTLEWGQTICALEWGQTICATTGSDTKPGYVNNSGNLSGGGTYTEGGADPGNYATYDGDGEPEGIGSP